MRICQPKGVRRVKEIQAYTTQRQRGKTEYLSSENPPSVYLLSFTEGRLLEVEATYLAIN